MMALKLQAVSHNTTHPITADSMLTHVIIVLYITTFIPHATSLREGFS